MRLRVRPLKRCLWIVAVLIPVSGLRCHAQDMVAYDIDMAREICDRKPLENVEGIWLYPEDGVTVLILNDNTEADHNKFPSYRLTVVDTTDASLKPGDVLGYLSATAEENTFKIELSTEKRNELLLKPKSVTATLSKDGEAFLFKRQKAPFKGRLTLNFSRLLPGFWKIISTGISQNPTGSGVQLPVGMVKVYPSYDGNGSSKRKVRYL